MNRCAVYCRVSVVLLLCPNAPFQRNSSRWSNHQASIRQLSMSAETNPTLNPSILAWWTRAHTVRLQLVSGGA
jgi:hypothetical protein